MLRHRANQKAKVVENGKQSDLLVCESSPGNKCDSEFVKMLLSIVYFGIILFLNSSMVILVDKRTPNRQKHPPLPDLILDNVTRISWGFMASEGVISGMLLCLLLMAFFHKNRVVIARRYFYIFGSCYFLRTITLPLTSLSLPSHHFNCPNYMVNMTLEDNFVKTFFIWSRQGFRWQGVHTCGDLMFSGHTCGLTLICLFLSAYTRGLRGHRALVVIFWLANLIGMSLILLAHEHYSIDVFIGFLVPFFLFRYYHVFANNPILYCQRQQKIMKQRLCGTGAAMDKPTELSFNSSVVSSSSSVAHLDKFCTERTFFPFFNYFEANCVGRVHFEYDWPFSKSSMLHRTTIKSTLCALFAHAFKL